MTDTIPIVTVDNKNDASRVLIIKSPELPNLNSSWVVEQRKENFKMNSVDLYLILPSNIPDVELQVPVLYSLDIEAYEEIQIGKKGA